MRTFEFNGRTYKVQDSQLFEQVNGCLFPILSPDPALDNQARLHGFRPSGQGYNLHAYGQQGGKRSGDKPSAEDKGAWTGAHSFPEEGWAIFFTKGNKPEVERIDEFGLLTGDQEAKVLAIRKGYKFDNPDNEFEVTNIAEVEARGVVTYKVWLHLEKCTNAGEENEQFENICIPTQLAHTGYIWSAEHLIKLISDLYKDQVVDQV